MKAAAFLFFLAGALLAVAAIYNLALFNRPGVYPPKQLLKDRAIALVAGMVLFLLFGLLIIFLA
ncbi:hypothetical protein [Bacillus sp. FJAT-27445]|uniref:hypothetical protein n=1 Tax=Bacillus sp. FJAT-27445 TaxID=1679166 RepID=UPI000743D9EC|nr:hypothetical protein [Bacillus sp. FJAT-27445]